MTYAFAVVAFLFFPFVCLFVCLAEFPSFCDELLLKEIKSLIFTSSFFVYDPMMLLRMLNTNLMGFGSPY